MKVLDRKEIEGKKIDSHPPLVETEKKTYPEFAEDMPHSENGLRVSEEEYWQKYYNHPDFQYEWNNGILEEKPMADYWSFEMYSWFFSLLKEFLKAYPIAKIVGLEIGFRLALRQKTTIRKPDLGVILNANPVGIVRRDRTYKGIFDMCIEFLSDSTLQEVERDTVEKKLEYAQGGVKEYFILDREGHETAFYRLNQGGTYSPILQSGGIIRSEVLSGFQFRVKDLYTHPPLEDKTDDEAYKTFILKKHQEQIRAERQRADAEAKRANAAEKRAEELIAKLRALGIEP